MSNPDINIPVPSVDSHITSTVLGEQKVRETVTESYSPEHTRENATYVAVDPFNTDTKHSQLEEMDENKTDVKANSETPKDDFVLTPVMTITKQEAVLTKGDMKLQRVSVTEDISDTNISTTVEQENYSVTNNGEPEIWTEVISVQQMRTETPTDDKDQPESRKIKTRIPTMRFRKAVDQLRRDRKVFEDKKEPETSQPTPPKSAIPRLKDSKSSVSCEKDYTATKQETTKTLPRLSDEFDKLYDEIVEDQDSLDNLSIISKIDDPVKLDNTFEEIIHAYEENEVQPINVEKVKQSRIPLLKRKSEHEIEVPKQTSPAFRQSVSVDLGRIKLSGSDISENHTKIHSVTLNKSPIRTSLISKRISEIKSVRESSTGYTEKLMALDAATIEKSSNSDKEFSILKKKETKEVPNINANNENNTSTEQIESDEVSMSIIEHMHESNKSKIIGEDDEDIKFVEKIEKQNICLQKEENRIYSVSSKTATKDKVHYDSLENINTVKLIEKSLSPDVLLDKNEEDIPILRGKVNRIIKRMDSKDTEIKQSKRDFEDVTHNEKSVLSKIAIFEHHKISDVTPTTVEPVSTNDDLSNEQPKIIEEVLKAVPAHVTEEKNNVDSGNNINDNNNNALAKYFDPTHNIDILNIENPGERVPAVNQHIKPMETALANADENVTPVIDVQLDKTFTNSNAVTKFNSTDNDRIFDIQIVDVQPKVGVQINKAHEKITPDENEINRFNFKSPTMILKNLDIRRPEIKSKGTSSNQFYDNDIYFDNNRIVGANFMDSKNSIQETSSKTAFIGTNIQWKGKQSNLNKKQYSAFYKDSKLDEPFNINNGPEVISDITKQEVKYERMKMDNQFNIKDNETFNRKTRRNEEPLRIHSYRNNELDMKMKSQSLAELDLGLEVKGRVKNIIVRMKSLDTVEAGKKEIIDIKERPRKKSVSEKIALFERKLVPIKLFKDEPSKIESKEVQQKYDLSEEECAKKIEELSLAKTKYGVLEPGQMKFLELRDGGRMPVIGIGTALLDPKLTRYVVQAAIDLGYRTIDTAYIYGNEKEVGEAINEKIKDGTVTRSELFIISKLWSTFHRRDLVQRACRASLDAMGLDYFDLYLIHNPMSFKEGGDPIPKIASVLQFSEHDYLDAWFGVETLVREGLVKRGGVSNFNSLQVDRVVEKGKIKPVVNQVECHPYLSQHRLDDFCQVRNVKLSCYGVLGSKGTPQEHKSTLPPAIDDPLVRVMAAGLSVSPAALLISYQLALDRGVVVKASSAAHLWDNLQALTFTPSVVDVSALHALNRNKRTFTFKGMGDTHRNYPFNIPF